jgi:DNA-binding PadR family transcriptional regulator
MFENEFDCERAEGANPQSAADQQPHGFGRAGARRRRRMGRLGRLIGHLRHRREGVDPWNILGRHADEASAFNYLEDGGDDMRGDDRGRRGGRRHRRGHEGAGFGWEFGGPQGRGPGQHGRPLEQGDLRWLTLDLIASQPRHGYEIIKAIEDALSGHYTPSPGVIYPTLTLLEETGLIIGEAQGSKKLYRLTDEGRAEVEAHAADISAARGRLEKANARFGGSPAPELHRAMNNLRAAIQVRLAKGQLSAEALGVITAALDRAAGEIERS